MWFYIRLKRQKQTIHSGSEYFLPLYQHEMTGSICNEALLASFNYVYITFITDINCK